MFEEEDRHSLDEMHRALISLKGELASLHVSVRLHRLRHALEQHRYNPAQPRVPRGHREGGQWTDDPAFGGDGIPYTRVQSRRPGGGNPPRGRGPLPVPSTNQISRGVAAFRDAENLTARVRQRDPNWQPPQSSITEPGSVEGEIYRLQSIANSARNRLQELAAIESAIRREYPGRERIFTERSLRSSTWRPLYDEIARDGELRWPLFGNSRNTISINRIEFGDLFDNLMRGATPIRTPDNYSGLFYRRGDGSIFGLRVSERFRLTIDIVETSDPRLE